MIYIFSAIAFGLLIPILLFLPIQMKRKTRLMIAMIAFLLGVVGIFVRPYLPPWQFILLLVLMAFVMAVFIDKRRDEFELEENEDVTSMTKEKRQIIIQDQALEIPHTKMKFNNSDKEPVKLKADEHYEEEEELFQERLTANKEIATTVEKEDTAVANDWLNDLDNFLDDKETINKNDTKDQVPTIESDFLNEIEDLNEIDIEPNHKKERKELKVDELFDVDTIDEIDFERITIDKKEK